MSAIRVTASLITFLAVLPLSHAQAEPFQQSLAEIAAKAKAKKADPSHIVLDDDSRELQKPILPDIWERNCDNSAEIITTIVDYRGTHSRNETEQLIHDWYDRNGERLTQARDENHRLDNAHADFNNAAQRNHYSSDSSDYPQYYEAQAAEERHINNDRSTYWRNYWTVAHIETVLREVKSGIARSGLDFDWFKLRCGNNVCDSTSGQVPRLVLPSR